MPPSRRWADDEGSASLEFLVVGLVLLVPLVYLVVALSAIQSAAFAAEGAARQAARVFVQSADEGSAGSAAQRALQFALADHGVDGAASLAVSCSAEPCLTRREFVTVSVRVDVPLPFVPFAAALPPAVQLSASATEQVSRFWGAR